MPAGAAAVLRAGLLGAALSGAPSTLHALATGRDPLAAAKAAGRLALPRERRTIPLLIAAVPVHLAISLFWAALIPRRAGALGGAACGAAIAALDLGLLAPAPIRALPTWPQIADHVAFGAIVGAQKRGRTPNLHGKAQKRGRTPNVR